MARIQLGWLWEGELSELSLPLQGRVAVVTGASSGIGRETAIALSSAGAKVALGARRVDRLTELTKLIQEKGGEAIAVKCDITKRQEAKNLVAQAEKELGPVDIMVNNAGVWYYSLIKNLHEDEWEEMVDVNCKGLLNCIAAVLDSMIKRDSGHIVNISSNAGRQAILGLGVYTGTKFFVEGITQSLRQEVATTGVRVTSIQPGKTAVEQEPPMDKEVKEIFSASPPVKEILQPTDVAQAVLYAVSQPPHVAVNELLVLPTEMAG